MSQRTIAFNVEPSERRYRLRLARYKAMAEAVGQFALERAPQGAPEGDSPMVATGLTTPEGDSPIFAARKLGQSPARKLGQSLVRKLGQSPVLDLLDVGVGSGRSLRFIEAEGVAERVRFYGVDNSDRRLASVYKPSRWRLAKADVEAGLPYGDEAFDVCLCEQVLEHLERPAAVVGEIARVLRPGGLAILGVPIFPPGAARLRRFGVGLLRRRFGVVRSHRQTFTCRSFVALVEAQGSLAVVARRGFRIVSGGPLAPLEDYAWWYRLNRRLGRAAPWLCTEVQVLARKEASRVSSKR